MEAAAVITQYEHLNINFVEWLKAEWGLAWEWEILGGHSFNGSPVSIGISSKIPAYLHGGDLRNILSGLWQGKGSMVRHGQSHQYREGLLPTVACGTEASSPFSLGGGKTMACQLVNKTPISWCLHVYIWDWIGTQSAPRTFSYNSFLVLIYL